ncbi:hypothetical protein WN48_08586 [Eufriesea mexicana]|nr:hypothetical protein WN48_08586 [Eufriesea mexicana]
MFEEKCTILTLIKRLALVKRPNVVCLEVSGPNGTNTFSFSRQFLRCRLRFKFLMHQGIRGWQMVDGQESRLAEGQLRPGMKIGKTSFNPIPTILRKILSTGAYRNSFKIIPKLPRPMKLLDRLPDQIQLLSIPLNHPHSTKIRSELPNFDPRRLSNPPQQASPGAIIMPNIKIPKAATALNPSDKCTKDKRFLTTTQDLKFHDNNLKNGGSNAQIIKIRQPRERKQKTHLPAKTKREVPEKNSEAGSRNAESGMQNLGDISVETCGRAQGV